MGRGARVLVLGLVFVAGWAASSAWSAMGRLRLIDELTGTVSVINESGTKLCLEQPGARQRCGVAYRRADARPLAVGTRATVVVAVLRTDEGGMEVFLVADP